MEYVYGLYNQRDPTEMRYVGRTDNPKRRLREHWNSRHDAPKTDRLWERRLNHWIRSLSDVPEMRILVVAGDEAEAKRAEHDAIIEARKAYGTAQILNDNEGDDNSGWFRKIMSGPDYRVRMFPSERIPAQTQSGKTPGSHRDNPSGRRDAPKLHMRRWLQANGYDIGDFGRVSAEMQEAFRLKIPYIEKEA